MPSLSPVAALDSLREALGLELRGVAPAAARRTRERVTAGFFNPVHPSTIQVLGAAGAAWLSHQAPAARRALPGRLRRRGMAVLIATGRAVDPGWRKAGIAVYATLRGAPEVVQALRRELAALGARRDNVHGVLLEMYGLGVLIVGGEGAGKGALALELISRGHALVADDAPELIRPAPGVLIGRCPPVLYGYLETRGLGVLDVRAMHGESSVRPHARLDFVVRLADVSRSRRAGGVRSTTRLLGETVPVISLAPGTGDNLAVRVEAACRDHWLRLGGVRADAAFAERQKNAIRATSGSRARLAPT
jgi:HPr kinase/phosphorylase